MAIQFPAAQVRLPSQVRTPTPTESLGTNKTPPDAKEAPRTGSRVALERNRDSFTPASSTRGPELTGASRTVAPTSSTQTTDAPRKVHVPVFPNDTEWDVALRSLPMLAKQSGLEFEGQKVFAEKWAARLYESGQTGLYSNSTGADISDSAFQADIEEFAPGDPSRPPGSLGTYPVEFTPEKHGAMFADLKQLKRNEALTSGIQDPALKRDLLLQLNQVSVGTGGDKTGAAQNLWTLASSGHPEADKVYGAIQKLAASEEMKFDATVKMTELWLDLDKQKKFIGPRDLAGDDAAMRARAEEAARLAGRRDFTTGMPVGKGGAPDRDEAAWVNKQAAMVLRESGDPQGALYREKVGRFFEVGPEERAEATNSTPFPTIPRWRETDMLGVRAPTQAELKQQAYVAKNGPLGGPSISVNKGFKKELQEDGQKLEFPKPRFTLNEKGELDMNEKGELKQSPHSRFQLEGALRAEGTVTVTQKQPLNEKGAKVKPGRPYYRTQTQTAKLPIESKVLNPTTVRRTRGASGGVSGLEEGNKWGSFYGDLVNDTTAKKVAEGLRLNRAVENALNYQVPPRPELLPKLRPQIEQLYGKQKGAEVMRQLEELSTAFYGREAPSSRVAPR
jgi:hypothetical protein